MAASEYLLFNPILSMVGPRRLPCLSGCLPVQCSLVLSSDGRRPHLLVWGELRRITDLSFCERKSAFFFFPTCVSQVLQPLATNLQGHLVLRLHTPCVLGRRLMACFLFLVKLNAWAPDLNCGASGSFPHASLLSRSVPNLHFQNSAFIAISGLI